MAKKEAMDECVEELVKAIILQAVEDYRNALMVLNWYQGQKQKEKARRIELRKIRKQAKKPGETPEQDEADAGQTSRPMKPMGKEARRKADGDRIGRITAEIADTERQITAAKEETERIRLEVRAMISQIKDPMGQKTIMLYYLENQTLQEISKEICYSRTQTFRLLETGLAEIERMLPYEKWNMMEHDGMQWNAME